METHPHLHLFEHQKKWKYLIIGTFPPNTSLREKHYIDYFYGNKGFLWKIIHDIYSAKGYDFFSTDKAKNLNEIKRWQNDYCVGLSDTILSCKRKDPLSSDDSDLTDIVYNLPLKDYILQNSDHLQKIIFTSTSGKNSAYRNFQHIMGTDISLISAKLVTGMPSPSGAGNISFFNTGKEETLGLTDDFYRFIVEMHPEHLPHFERTWKMKKQKKAGTVAATTKIPPAPAGIVTEYKHWRYSQVLPQDKCR